MPKKKNPIVKVNVTRLKQVLKENLDKIDEKAKNEFLKGYYDSRVHILMSMWRKGKAIDVFFRGVKNTISYYRLEKETGRRRANLKQWRELYTKHRDMNAYRQIAEKKAKEWTENAYAKFLSKSELTNNETKQLPEDTEKDEYPMTTEESEKFERLKFEEMGDKRIEKFYKAHNSICDDSEKLHDSILECCKKFKCRVCMGELEELRLFLNKISHEENERFRDSA